MRKLASKDVAAPLAILAFWCGMTAAAHAYPAGYDWRYQTISVLLYPDRNPRGYLWAWAGLELCGLAGIAWTAQLLRRRESTIAGTPPTAGVRVLQLGFLCMCCALLPDGLLPWPRLHEMLAILAFLGLCIGVTCQMWVMLDHREFSLLPLVLAGSTQAYLTLERPSLPWVSPRWRTLGISPLLSFGLWEWISCAVLTVCLLVLWDHHYAEAPCRRRWRD